MPCVILVMGHSHRVAIGKAGQVHKIRAILGAALCALALSIPAVEAASVPVASATSPTTCKVGGSPATLTRWCFTIYGRGDYVDVFDVPITYYGFSPLLAYDVVLVGPGGYRQSVFSASLRPGQSTTVSLWPAPGSRHGGLVLTGDYRVTVLVIGTWQQVGPSIDHYVHP